MARCDSPGECFDSRCDVDCRLTTDDESKYVRTVGDCLTLGGHDGSPCSFCGHTSRPRPPAIPKPKCCGGRWNGASIVHKDECEAAHDA